MVNTGRYVFYLKNEKKKIKGHKFWHTQGVQFGLLISQLMKFYLIQIAHSHSLIKTLFFETDFNTKQNT